MRRRFRQSLFGLRSEAAIRSFNEIVAAKGPTPGRNKIAAKVDRNTVPSSRESPARIICPPGANPKQRAGYHRGIYDKKRPHRVYLQVDSDRMTDEIQFDRSFDAKPGVAEEIAPGVRRILCDNPSPFTFKGTNTYIVGKGSVAIIDPGPADPQHIQAILAALGTETVAQILVTHTHRDHSPAAAAIRQATGSRTFGEGPHRSARELHLGETPPLDSGGDLDFVPDHALADGEVIEGKGYALETVYTPGHCANHVAFALRGTDILFSADHVMGWATSIVAPPDGSMSDYMASLHKLERRPESVYLPGHGAPVRNAHKLVQQYIEHREAREAAILRKLSRGESDIPGIVQAIYIGLDPRLTKAAALTTYAHLETLVERDLVQTDGSLSLAGRFRLSA
jgi:glyoxylase-like metal-dependent hydrolase (beta-lactamase superfamily II)